MAGGGCCDSWLSTRCHGKFGVGPTSVAGGVWQGTVDGGGEGLVVCGVEDAGVGKRNQEKLTQLPFCRVGGAEFPTILGDSGFSRCTLHFSP